MGNISEAAFYILSYTWGLPLTLIGHLVELVLRICSFKVEKYYCCHKIVIGHNWGGCSIGRTILCDGNANTAESILKHEHGHAIQNCFFGFFMPFAVSIPSAVRYWYRNAVTSCGKDAKLKAYDAIWFEDQATKTGTFFVDKRK